MITPSDVLFAWDASHGIIPTVGGQPSFSRGGDKWVRTRTRKGVALSRVRGDQLPFAWVEKDGVLLSRRALDLELARTQVLLDVSDFSTANWTDQGGPITTVDDALAPDGTKTADKVEDDSSTGVEGKNQAVSVGDDSVTRCGVLFVRKQEAFNNTVELQLLYRDGTTTLNYIIQLNPATGETNVRDGSPASAGALDYGDYWKLWIAGANNSTGNTTLNFRFFPAVNNTGTDGTAVTDGTGAAHFWGANLYTTSFPLSHIASNVSKPADGLKWTGGPDGSIPFAGYVSFVATMNDDGEISVPQILDVARETDPTNAPRLQIDWNGAKNRIFYENGSDNVAQASVPSTPVPGDLVEVGWALKPGGDVYVARRINGGSAAGATGSGPTGGLDPFADNLLTLNAFANGNDKGAGQYARVLCAKRTAVDSALDGTDDAGFLNELADVPIGPHTAGHTQP